MNTTTDHQLVLVTAATGKTGRRVADRLERLGIASRRAAAAGAWSGVAADDAHVEAAR